MNSSHDTPTTKKAPKRLANTFTRDEVVLLRSALLATEVPGRDFVTTKTKVALTRKLARMLDKFGEVTQPGVLDGA